MTPDEKAYEAYRTATHDAEQQYKRVEMIRLELAHAEEDYRELCAVEDRMYQEYREAIAA